LELTTFLGADVKVVGIIKHTAGEHVDIKDDAITKKDNFILNKGEKRKPRKGNERGLLYVVLLIILLF